MYLIMIIGSVSIKHSRVQQATEMREVANNTPKKGRNRGIYASNWT
jgi:hypothetical protein